jgi:hypothetical protein
MLDHFEAGMPDLAGRHAWTPPPDAVLDYLLREALSGGLPVYVGAVPLARLRRFRDDFRPERTLRGRRVVQAIFEQWRADSAPRLWVYPRGDVFMVSDDYLTLAAAERGQDAVPCWILGRGKDLPGARGPLDPHAVRRLLGVH